MKKSADTLRELRLDKRLTQKDVAAKLKISQAYYSSVERGEKPGEVPAALGAVNRMRTRTDRTVGGEKKAGRLK